jgi:predicted amidohydrolase
MFDTGFTFDLLSSADDDHATLEFLRDIAAKWSVYVHGCRTFRDQDGRGRNRTSVLAPDGRTLAEYDKRRPFSLGPPGKRESDSFTGGSKCIVYDWRAGAELLRVCPLICYDLRFPELFRDGLAAGAEMFIVPANWPDTRLFHWKTLLAARAIENQAFVLGVNRAGRDPALKYPGASMAIDPIGQVLAQADSSEQVLSVDIDRKLLDDWRAKFPAWKDAGIART